MICNEQRALTLADIFHSYAESKENSPLFVHGDALFALKQMPDDFIDFCMTSPPYWNKREYSMQVLVWKVNTKII